MILDIHGSLRVHITVIFALCTSKKRDRRTNISRPFYNRLVKAGTGQVELKSIPSVLVSHDSESACTVPGPWNWLPWIDVIMLIITPVFFILLHVCSEKCGLTQRVKLTKLCSEPRIARAGAHTHTVWAQGHDMAPYPSLRVCSCFV